jgi:predicted transcriptional regulator
MQPTEPDQRRERLLHLLDELNIVNAEAARFCGVKERSFYRWLSGERAISQWVINIFELLLDKKEATLKK